MKDNSIIFRKRLYKVFSDNYTGSYTKKIAKNQNINTKNWLKTFLYNKNYSEM